MLRTLLEPFSNPVWPILSIGSVLFLLQYKFVCSTTQKSTRRRVSSNISNLRQNRKYPNTLGIFLLNYALVRTNQLPWPHLTTEKRFYLSIVTIQPVFLPTQSVTGANWSMANYCFKFNAVLQGQLRIVFRFCQFLCDVSWLKMAKKIPAQ